MHVAVSEYDTKTQKRVARQYTLLCKPSGGSMPDADRLCQDIAQHPLAMLNPGRSRSVCDGSVNGPEVSVSSIWNGRPTSVSGEPGCGWPGGTGLAIYWAAADGNEHVFSQLEPRLRCDDDPRLLAMPIPWRSVFACSHGLWTPRTAKLIRTAEQVPPIPGLEPKAIFPSEIGTQRCEFVGGGLGLHKLGGYCEVNVTHVWHNPQVTFTESWAAGRHVHRHTWIVTVVDGQAKLTKQTGPAAPQFWM